MEFDLRDGKVAQAPRRRSSRSVYDRWQKRSKNEASNGRCRLCRPERLEWPGAGRQRCLNGMVTKVFKFYCRVSVSFRRRSSESCEDLPKSCRVAKDCRGVVVCDRCCYDGMRCVGRDRLVPESVCVVFVAINLALALSDSWHLHYTREKLF